MKAYIIFMLYFLGTGVYAQSNDENLVVTTQNTKEQNTVSKLDPKPVRDLVIITGARFMPIGEFLGLPDVNDLPPPSAGPDSPPELADSAVKPQL